MRSLAAVVAVVTLSVACTTLPQPEEVTFSTITSCADLTEDQVGNTCDPNLVFCPVKCENQQQAGQCVTVCQTWFQCVEGKLVYFNNDNETSEFPCKDVDAGPATDTLTDTSEPSDTGAASDTGVVKDTATAADVADVEDSAEPADTTPVKDTSAKDTAAEDTTAKDTTVKDTMANDTGGADAGAQDIATGDLPLADTGKADTGPADTGSADTATPDAGGGVSTLNKSTDPLYTSCQEEYTQNGHTQSGVVWIDPDGPTGGKNPYKVYCLKPVGGGGASSYVWTLVMKVREDAAEFAFQFDNTSVPNYWTAARSHTLATLNPEELSLDGKKSAKFYSYYDIPVTEVMIGMPVGSNVQLKQFSVDKQPLKPLSEWINHPSSGEKSTPFAAPGKVFGTPTPGCIQSGTCKSTVWPATRSSMQELIQGAEVQNTRYFCGFNAHIGALQGLVPSNPVGVRIGCVGDDGDGSADSWIGVGGSANICLDKLKGQPKYYSGSRGCFLGTGSVHLTYGRMGFVFVR